MWKFIRGKSQQPLADRQKLQKELFAYQKTVQHGFPHKPSAIAYDPTDKLMAIGTTSGVIKIFGRPGVEYYGQHTSMTNNGADCTVQLLEWVPGTGRVLSLTTANQLILWEPASKGTLLIPIKNFPFDGKLKKVSSLCCSQEKDLVWIGTEGGNVYQFDLKAFSIRDPVIYHDVVFEQVPPTYKLNPGAIESVRQLPNNHNQLIIAYNRGLCVLWDLEMNSVVRSYISPGHGQSVGITISQSGHEFTWFHADGSYATWRVGDSDSPDNNSNVPYGPDPCKSINNLVKGKRGKQDIVIFSGGMPRSAFGDRQCVSVHCLDGTKICLDFTSKVIDFFVTFNEDHRHQVDVLIVLLEEELCAFDLTDPSLPPVKLPYLHSVHASAITCNHLVSQVSLEVYERICKAGEKQQADFSEIEWPITGGYVQEKGDDPATKEYEILLTGHEDGSVKFWDCTDVVLIPILQFKTAPLFSGTGDHELDDVPHDSQEQLDESEPPFRKAGLFDPYSDDPRFAVKKIAMCPKTGQLIVAGTAGHVVVAGLNHRIGEGPLKSVTMNLVSDRDGFIWKGHDQLKLKAQLLDEELPPVEAGLQVVSVLQILPPAAVTCLALQTNWNLVAAGTAHGLVLYDYFNNYPVLNKCTLNPNDLTGAGEQLSRRKSFKKTLRESFRRLRKGRSTRQSPSGAPVPATTIETRPIERQVEARPVDDGMGSMVRCLTFAQTFITNIHSTIPTLWSATNASCVSVYVLNIPNKPANETPPDQRKMIIGHLAKSIQLKHRAPVVGIAIFDNAGVPLDLSGPGTAPHRVLIASEEQFKVFSLPQLKPVTKYKLTAHEGARVRRMSFASFSCIVPASMLPHHSPVKSSTTTDVAEMSATTNDEHAANDDRAHPPTHTEVGLMCLTNLGDCVVLSIPELKRQINAAAVRREDINGISSLCFTNYGEALYMMSSSELQRVSLSATRAVTMDGTIELEPLSNDGDEPLSEDNIKSEEDVDEVVSSPLSAAIDDALHSSGGMDGTGNVERDPQQHLTNGTDDSSPRTTAYRPNETITSSMGDITVDSVRDHLNSTVTTLHTTTTEEIVGRLSVLSTQTNNTVSSINMKDITDINLPNFKDLSPIGDTTETNTSSVVIKSVITSITHGPQPTSETTHQNGDTNGGSPDTMDGKGDNLVTTQKVVTTRKESQF